MKKLLEAQNILIIPDRRIDLDLMAASITLAEVLKDAGKKVSLLVDNSNYPKFIESIFPRRGIEVFNMGKTREYVLTVADQKDKVNKVDWTQENEKIMLVITTEKGEEIKGKTKLEKATGIFDQVIMIGSKDPQDLGKLYRENEELFEEKKLVQVKHEKNIAKQTHASVHTNSLSENVFDMLRENKLTISKYAATYLLIGIYWKTAGFTENITSSKIFENVKALIDLGGDVFVAVRKALQTLTEQQAKFISETLGKLQIDADGIGFVTVTEEVGKNLNLSYLIFKKWDLVKYIVRAKAVVIFIPKGKFTSGFFFTNSKKVDAYETVKNYKGQGTYEKAAFSFELPIEKVRLDIKQQILTQLKGKQEKPAQSDFDQAKVDTVKVSTTESGKVVQTQKVQTNGKPVVEEKKLQQEPAFMRKREETKVTQVVQKPVMAPPPQPKPVQPVQPTPSFGNYDPLAPATDMPEPLRLEPLENKPKQPTFNSPLPPAE